MESSPEKEKILRKLKGIKRTTGQHPGGLLIIPEGIKILDYTPLNYPAGDNKSEWLTTHFEYSYLSKIFLKMDMLGHDEPTVLYELQKMTKFKIKDIDFKDKKVMEIFTKADVLGIPEFGTNFNKKNFLIPLKPDKFSQLVQISGFSHGTNVWIDNQQDIWVKGEVSLDNLIACREDVWKFLISCGINKNDAFKATEIIRRETKKWEDVPEEIRNDIENNLKKNEKETYLSILKKIKYLFPKPHAVAYTINAWRVAYYKIYYPKEFYSVLLTHHVSVYDVWLMSLNRKIISFRIKYLVENIDKYKNTEKELFSIIKVIKELNKELRKSKKESFDDIIKEFEKKIMSSNQDLLYKYRKSINIWRMTSKEESLLFSLKIVEEMNFRGIELKKGFDLNRSDEENFKIEENIMFFPISSISGIGKKASEKITEYRKKQKIKKESWKDELKFMNSNQINELLKLEDNDLMIW